MQSYRAFCEGLGIDASDVADARRLMEAELAREGGDHDAAPGDAPSAAPAEGDGADSDASVEEFEVGPGKPTGRMHLPPGVGSRIPMKVGAGRALPPFCLFCAADRGYLASLGPFSSRLSQYGAFSAEDGASDCDSGDEGPAYVPSTISRATGGASVPSKEDLTDEQPELAVLDAGTRPEGAESPAMAGDAATAVEDFRLDPEFDYENAPIEERAMPQGYPAPTALVACDDAS